MAQKKSSESPSNGAGLFKDTLNLPRTEFPIRADAKINDPIMLARWADEQLYTKATACHEGAKKFILHDGPPYANGNIHLGHAYNKILKDIASKSQRMMGFHTPVIPGWDCHGLPIELKVTQEHPGIAGVELKKACRDYAMGWINIQRDEFKALGVVMDWENPYITMSPSYEASILRAFGDFVDKGFIERKNKTITWCPTCKTALASAEIEYQDRKDPSIYVLFELDGATRTRVFPEIDQPVNFVVWTTTPWTIPLNRAVMLRPGADYQLIKIKDQYLIIGAALAEKLANEVESEYEVVKTFKADELAGGQAQHPIVADLQVPVLLDNSVGLDEGTACVHSAPGCGPIDYEIGVKNNLEIYSPLTADGSYDEGIMPEELKGVSISDGQIWVIKRLAADGKLFYKKSIRHSYPHCWRCRNGLIFRATPQWFCSLEHDGVRQKALQATEDIAFSPEQGKNFLRATVENRWEWCLSRQRSWGVPIPALISVDGLQVYTNKDLIDKVAEKVATEGIEYWDRVSINDLVNDGIVPQDFPIDGYRKESDILDVWFESGVSHYAVIEQNPLLQFPADLYLEGIDQYRAWFQSSLLTSIVLNGCAPMHMIMSHGFTVDEKGHKMSKSLGNTVAPQDIIDKLGTDGLRLWVASIGNDGDAVVSDTLLSNVSQVLRKIRNTCRFLLQNLYDYDHATNAVALKDLYPIDRYALRQLAQLQERALRDYKAGNFTAIFHAVSDYCAVELSSFYGDIVKDRLYCEQVDGLKRRSTQTVFWYTLDALARLVAPIMSFTAEQVSDYYQQDKVDSIHLQKFADLSFVKDLFAGTDLAAYDLQWKQLKDMRSAVLKAIEIQREKGDIKHSLEVGIKITYEKLGNFTILGDEPEQFLREFFIVSQVDFLGDDSALEKTAVPGLYVLAAHAAGVKCPRCWQWDVQADDQDLCRRCQLVIK
jgi:isoleucyl-tRNA synthetase